MGYRGGGGGGEEGRRWGWRASCQRELRRGTRLHFGARVIATEQRFYFLSTLMTVRRSESHRWHGARHEWQGEGVHGPDCTALTARPWLHGPNIRQAALPLDSSVSYIRRAPQVHSSLTLSIHGLYAYKILWLPASESPARHVQLFVSYKTIWHFSMLHAKTHPCYKSAVRKTSYMEKYEHIFRVHWAEFLYCDDE